MLPAWPIIFYFIFFTNTYKVIMSLQWISCITGQLVKRRKLSIPYIIIPTHSWSKCRNMLIQTRNQDHNFVSDNVHIPFSDSATLRLLLSLFLNGTNIFWIFFMPEQLTNRLLPCLLPILTAGTSLHLGTVIQTGVKMVFGARFISDHYFNSILSYADFFMHKKSHEMPGRRRKKQKLVERNTTDKNRDLKFVHN